MAGLKEMGAFGLQVPQYTWEDVYLFNYVQYYATLQAFLKIASCLYTEIYC
jgi:hypothetical protein